MMRVDQFVYIFIVGQNLPPMHLSVRIYIEALRSDVQNISVV